MSPASAAVRKIATQASLATRKERLANLAAEVGECVGKLRALMVASAPHGLASALASAMGWRIERRSRELSGVEKLSVAGVRAEIQLHLIEGRRDIADRLVAVLLDGISPCAEIPLTSDSLLRVVEHDGKRYLRSEQ